MLTSISLLSALVSVSFALTHSRRDTLPDTDFDFIIVGGQNGSILLKIIRRTHYVGHRWYGWLGAGQSLDGKSFFPSPRH